MKHFEEREISDIKRKFLELQDYLEVLNQLERVPECELKKALEKEINDYINPSHATHSMSIERSSGKARRQYDV